MCALVPFLLGTSHISIILGTELPSYPVNSKCNDLKKSVRYF